MGTWLGGKLSRPTRGYSCMDSSGKILFVLLLLLQNLIRIVVAVVAKSCLCCCCCRCKILFVLLLLSLWCWLWRLCFCPVLSVVHYVTDISIKCCPQTGVTFPLPVHEWRNLWNLVHVTHSQFLTSCDAQFAGNLPPASRLPKWWHDDGTLR